LIYNIGVPPSLSFFSEVFIIAGIGGVTIISFFICFILLFFTGVYGIYLFVLVYHGPGFLSGFFFVVSVREYLLFYGHIFYILFIPLYLSLFF